MHVRYFAGAAAAIGTEEETLHGTGTTLDVLLNAHPAAATILRKCSLLHAGKTLSPNAPWPHQGTLDVLPPFAGG